MKKISETPKLANAALGLRHVHRHLEKAFEVLESDDPAEVTTPPEPETDDKIEEIILSKNEVIAHQITDNGAKSSLNPHAEQFEMTYSKFPMRPHLPMSHNKFPMVPQYVQYLFNGRQYIMVPIYPGIPPPPMPYRIQTAPQKAIQEHVTTRVARPPENPRKVTNIVINDQCRNFEKNPFYAL